MRIVHLSVGDPFTAKWVNSQVRDGHEVYLVMLEPEQEKLEGVKTYILPFPKPFGYFLNVFHLKFLLRKIKPDLMHVHYASGNGTLGRLSGYRPSILSVWGSDVMVAPFKSRVMHRLVFNNLRYYDWVCSTSRVMGDHVLNFCPQVKNLTLTPIGVDLDCFSRKLGLKRQDTITVGTVKTLDHIYGIDVLIHSFAKTLSGFKHTNPAVAARLRLMIVGGGPQEAELRTIAQQLGIYRKVEFVGQVAHHKVPEYLNLFDIFVAMSRIESFGVSLLEASSCELPVVASRVGGIPEVVEDRKTGFLIPPEDTETCSMALSHLILDPVLRESMGKAGRRFVHDNYSWAYCMNRMYSVYDFVSNMSRS